MAKRLANNGSYVAKKPVKSTGKAAWVLSTLFLILVVPLLIQMVQEQLVVKYEMLQGQSQVGGVFPSFSLLLERTITIK
ncbi:hypothetical protein ACLB2K_006642 [Fragaria x ananassa]